MLLIHYNKYLLDTHFVSGTLFNAEIAVEKQANVFFVFTDLI